MSNAFRCDICKKFYARGEEDTAKRIKYHGTAIHAICLLDSCQKFLKRFDLCPECVKALDDFMNHPDLEEKEEEEEEEEEDKI